LAEEVGLQAASMRHLATYAVAPGISDERLHLYLATELSPVPRHADGPEEEAMTTERVRLADVEDLVLTGVIADAKTIIGLLLARGVLAGR
jgi:hypothetical protein